MVRKLFLIAAAAVVAAALLPAPADAAPYRVLRWHGTGVCQVWDYGFSYPWGWYDVLSRPKATFHRAVHKQHRLWHRGICPNG